MPHITRPEDVVELMHLHGPMVVADFGSGAGFFTIPIAERLSQKGIVYALDIQEEPLEVVRTTARTRQLHNVRTLRADIEKIGGSHVKTSSVDRVLISHVLFQSAHQKSILEEAFRILKKGGTLVVVEWSAKSPLPHGPKKDMRILKPNMLSLLLEVGFIKKREFDFGDHSYGIIAVKKDE